MTEGEAQAEAYSTHLQEVRRGTVVLACLYLLRDAGYGYGLLEALQAAGFQTDANTLYPLLRRLEKQGYLTSAWNTDEARPRKFYRTSPEGERLAEALADEWHTLTRAIDGVTRTARKDRS
ncbi:PadR family transcriptional regulator [Kocuria coralli]|uniref:PadR family transcriptional regulator n=1 Tax=Kocuria coralli TaxID=1461025 RepID=A0A5J5KXY9_9MICC|nr:PadR family transcriptional regulator [Kocuria coralli]KAA9394382.1 PadR family transcriptional regulator [Kocuria coralli]